MAPGGVRGDYASGTLPSSSAECGPLSCQERSCRQRPGTQGRGYRCLCVYVSDFIIGSVK